MKTKYLMQGAIIAAVYAVLTIMLAPISYGPMQVRVSEAMPFSVHRASRRP